MAPKSRAGRRLAGAFDLLCLATSVVLGFGIYRQFPEISERVGWPNKTDQIVFPILAFLVLEGARRTLGWTLTLLTAVFILYCYFGNHFPWLFEHRGFSHHRVTGVLYVESTGVSEPVPKQLSSWRGRDSKRGVEACLERPDVDASYPSPA